MPQPHSLSSLQSTAAPDFEDPFGMLHACHERVARTLALLERLQTHMDAHGADNQARQAAIDVMRYFDLAAPQHHLDEELHVFPAAIAGGEPSMLALVNRLREDHIAMEARWHDARAVLRRIELGDLQALSSRDTKALRAFAGLYGSHVEAEEQLVYPRAASALEPAAMQAMGAEMSHRRGAA